MSPWKCYCADIRLCSMTLTMAFPPVIQVFPYFGDSRFVAIRRDNEGKKFGEAKRYCHSNVLQFIILDKHKKPLFAVQRKLHCDRFDLALELSRGAQFCIIIVIIEFCMRKMYLSKGGF